MRHIDGSFGEGGGQILRTSLALSLVTGVPFRIERIRANRKKPGLRRQHVTCVNAAAEVGQAEVKGNVLGSTEFYYAPGAARAGQYHFSIGTAGSTTLVLQTILPALLTTDAPSGILLEGGTHNDLAPSFDFLKDAFLPVIRRMGPKVTVTLERPGFYPAGGGKFSAHIEPAGGPSQIEIPVRGRIQKRRATAVVANLKRHIAEREITTLRKQLGWEPKEFQLEETSDSDGPGNVVTILIESKHITEVFTGFGKRGVSAEKVAGRVAKDVQDYLDADVPVGQHLADQLIIPMALAGGGKFRTLKPTQHTLTNIEVVKHFLDIHISVTQINNKVWEIELFR